MTSAVRDNRFVPLCVILAVAPVATLPTLAVAADYLSAAQAQKLMFPEATRFVPVRLSASPDQARALADRNGGNRVQTLLWNVSAAMAGDTLLGYVVVDAVTGKFELINYAVALTPQGEIRDVEILSYREAHGGEVRSAAWRRQFIGRSARAPLSVGNDIANISGATLSCTHLTEGIRRIALYAQLVLAAQG